MERYGEVRRWGDMGRKVISFRQSTKMKLISSWLK